jgi:hypothetical protein
VPLLFRKLFQKTFFFLSSIRSIHRFSHQSASSSELQRLSALSLAVIMAASFEVVLGWLSLITLATVFAYLFYLASPSLLSQYGFGTAAANSRGGRRQRGIDGNEMPRAPTRVKRRNRVRGIDVDENDDHGGDHDVLAVEDDEDNNEANEDDNDDEEEEEDDDEVKRMKAMSRAEYRQYIIVREKEERTLFSKAVKANSVFQGETDRAKRELEERKKSTAAKMKRKQDLKEAGKFVLC